MNSTSIVAIIVSACMVLISAVVITVYPAGPVLANTLECQDGTPVPQPAPYPGYSSDFCADKGGVSVPSQSVGPLGSAGDLGLPTVDADQSQFQNLLNVVFMIVGGLAAIFIIVGGIQYVMSIGNPDRIEKAKNTILYAVIGLVVTLFASVIVNFVVSSAL